MSKRLTERTASIRRKKAGERAFIVTFKNPYYYRSIRNIYYHYLCHSRFNLDLVFTQIYFLDSQRL